MIIKYILHILQYGASTAQDKLQNPTNDIEQEIAQAVTFHSDIQNSALEKGFISSRWAKAQQLWEQLHPSRTKNNMWERNLVILLQQYTLSIWDKRNKLLHGETKKENKEIRLHKCRDKVRTLYKYPRQELTIKERRYFNLPLRYRLKGSISAMELWIEVVETIYRKKEQSEQGKITNWLYLHERTNSTEEISMEATTGK